MFKLKLPPFENVVASGTAVLPRLPRGNMYAGIGFVLGGGNTQANMSAIRLLLNGKIVWNISGTHLDTINNYDRLKDTATALSMWFADPTIQNPIESQLGAIDTSRGVDEMALEVDLGAGLAPTLSAFYWALPPSPKGDRFASVFKSMLRTVHAPGAAVSGQNQQVALGSKAGGFLRRNHFFHANITRLAVKRDGVNVLDDQPIADINYANEARWRTAQSGHIAFDPLSQQASEDMLPTLRSDGSPAVFEHLVTTSAADTITAYTELLASLDRV